MKHVQLIESCKSSVNLFFHLVYFIIQSFIFAIVRKPVTLLYDVDWCDSCAIRKLVTLSRQIYIESHFNIGILEMALLSFEKFGNQVLIGLCKTQNEDLVVNNRCGQPCPSSF